MTEEATRLFNLCTKKKRLVANSHLINALRKKVSLPFMATLSMLLFEKMVSDALGSPFSIKDVPLDGTMVVPADDIEAYFLAECIQRSSRVFDDVIKLVLRNEHVLGIVQEPDHTFGDIYDVEDLENMKLSQQDCYNDDIDYGDFDMEWLEEMEEYDEMDTMEDYVFDSTYRTYKKDHIIFLGNLYSLLHFFSHLLISLQRGNRWKYNVFGEEEYPFSGFDPDDFELPHVPLAFSTEDLIEASEKINYLKDNLPENFQGWLNQPLKLEWLMSMCP